MSPMTRSVKQHAKARRRRYRTAQERMARDRRQAQHAAEALQQALDDLGLPGIHLRRDTIRSQPLSARR